MRLLLLTWFVLAGFLAAAQSPRPSRPTKSARTTGRTAPRKPASPPRPAVVYKDLLYKLDQSSQPVKISELTDASVIYLISSAPGVRQTIDRSQVWKVAFSDGSEEIITPLRTADPPSTAAAVAATPAASAPSASTASTSTTTAQNQQVVYGQNKKFSRFHLTIGPELAYYPAFLNKDRAWLNDSTGFGMKQNVGASIRIDYQFVRPLALSFTAGYYGWELVRTYTRNATAEYNETKRLTQLPVQVGLKIYPLKGVYLMPEGGVTFVFSSLNTSDAHPTPSSESVRSMPVTYGGSLGYEMHGRAILLDLSLRYQLFNVKNLQFTNFQQTLTEQVSIASVRLGIGFHSPTK